MFYNFLYLTVVNLLIQILYYDDFNVKYKSVYFVDIIDYRELSIILIFMYEISYCFS
jgi:hypothetical protein